VHHGVLFLDGKDLASCLRRRAGRQPRVDRDPAGARESGPARVPQLELVARLSLTASDLQVDQGSPRATTCGNVSQSHPIGVLAGFPKLRAAGSIPAEGTEEKSWSRFRLPVSSSLPPCCSSVSGSVHRRSPPRPRSSRAGTAGQRRILLCPERFVLSCADVRSVGATVACEERPRAHCDVKSTQNGHR
jgi:hypothetical protein